MFGKRRAAAQAAAKKPICGCGHHWSHHDGKSHCHYVALVHMKKEVVERDAYGDARLRYGQPITSTEVSTERMECTCQRYYGPEPHPEYIVPPMAEIEGD